MNILIVDDELEILEGLKVMVKETAIGYTFSDQIYTASDGLEALDLLTTTDIDLVFTDIRMPRMDGLELSETIHSRYPYIKIVIVSGYDDFHFMQAAIRHGVCDYLLKPIQADNLYSIVKLVRSELQQRKISNLIWDVEKFTKFEAPWKLVLVCDPDYIMEESMQEIGDARTIAGLFHKGIQAIIEEESQDYCLLKHIDVLEISNITVGIYGDSSDSVIDKGKRVMEKIRSFWNKYFPLSASFGLYAWVHSPETNVNDSLFYAKRALFSRVIEKNTTHIYYNQKPLPGKNLKLNLTSLSVALETAQSNNVNLELEAALRVLIQSGDVHTLTQGIEKILIAVCNKMQERNSERQIVNVNDLAHFMNSLLWSQNVVQLFQRIISWTINQLETNIDDRQGGQILYRAKEYIRQHLNLKLTLTDVGQAIYVSPNHLSRLFRERLAITFLEYITNLRMDKAKILLLEPGIKIYEVADSVGYGSWKHFSRAFKELTGLSPADYRKLAIPG